jgi:hypothetical protein
LGFDSKNHKGLGRAFACTPICQTLFSQEFAMPLPPATHPCWQRLASGALSRLKTDHLGTQLMAKRVERGTEPLSDKAAMIHAFFSRWERALPNEVAQLPTL